MGLGIFQRIVLAVAVFLFLASLTPANRFFLNKQVTVTDSLRQLYARPVSQWPKPNIDKNIAYQELGALPRDSSWLLVERDAKIKLGQLLFFDPRLSGSNQVSCSSCHDPGMAWGDSRRVSLGNEHREGKRNTISLLNVGAQKTFFWDGRSESLGDQAINPLATAHEMNMDVPLLASKISTLAGYVPYFEKAYGDKEVTLDRIIGAITAFEGIIKSQQSKFDQFVNGNYHALTDQQIRGLHLFRGKARCMNCHHGVYFKDDDYHNIGLTDYGRTYQDLGRYEVTRDPKDVGKFRTPSLRDVMNTDPWMHNGLFTNMMGVLNIYNSGMHMLDDEAKDINDPLYPKTDELLQPLALSEEEKHDLMAFLYAITATQYNMRRPELPE